jgi:NADPH:quinone reductase-like Zn-dependent oxidoreductase
VFAAVLRTHGEPPVYGRRPNPSPRPGHTLVRVSAAPIVPLDLLCASGTSYFGPPVLPYVPGVQGVGTVERSDILPAGTRVWFATSAGLTAGDGSLAELCAVPDGDLVPLESPVPDATVAALGLSAVAAWMALSWRARLRPTESVLVLGAGGAVGQAAIGAALALGAGRVIALCRSAEAQDRARRAGAHDVVPMCADADELTALLREATGGSVDVVVDPVFGVAATAASRILASGGRLVNIGGASGDEATFSSAVLRGRAAEILGYTNNSLSAGQRREALEAVLMHAASGRLAVIYETQALDSVTDAWRRQSRGDVSGRLVLTVAS